MLKFQYSELEQKTLNELYEKYKSFAPIILPNVPQEVIDTFKAINAIEEKAEQRAVEYYSTRLEELVDDIQSDVRFYLIAASKENPDFLNKGDWKTHQKVALMTFLELLKKGSPELYQKAIKIIDDTYEHREEIINSQKLIEQETIKETAKMNAKRANEIVLTVDKISKTIFNREKNETLYEASNPDTLVSVGPDKGYKGKLVTALVRLDISKLESLNLTNGVKLTPFERSLHRYALSLYLEGNRGITLNMIYHAMNGYSRTDKVPEQMRKAIEEGMRKLMYTGIKIDNTAHDKDTISEVKAYKAKIINIEAYLLPLTIINVEMNGQRVECYKFLDTPPLFVYADSKNQISRREIQYLAVPLSATPENIVIRDYLFEQIIDMQHKKNNRNDIIRYDTLYAYLGLDAPNDNAMRQKRLDVRKKVRDILNAWIQMGFITGFIELDENNEPAKERKPIAKVKILTEKQLK